MSISVTLRLSEKVVERARETALRTGQDFEAVLAEWLENLTISEDKLPFEPGKTYPIYTPFFDNDGLVAQKMLEALEEAKSDYNKKHNQAK